jgi:hypothetical protein
MKNSINKDDSNNLKVHGFEILFENKNKIALKNFLF